MFLASFVDAISGGGGLLSLPAYLFTGMPVHNAYACNKLCCNISTAMSAGRYLKNNLIDKKAAFFVGAVTLFRPCLKDCALDAGPGFEPDAAGFHAFCCDPDSG